MARDLNPVRITGNKQNMWTERKRKLAKQKEVEAFLLRF